MMKPGGIDTTGTVSLTVQNPAANNQPTIFVGVSAALHVTLSNQTGSDITLQSGASLEIYMPSYFSSAQVGAMSVINISQSGWTFSADATDVSLMLTYIGNGKWSNGSSLTFTISNVLSTSAPSGDTVQVNFNINGNNIPAQVAATLLLNNPIAPGNADLTTVLQPATEYGGEIYVSAASDPLTNTLYINFKNVGTNPLYNGAAMWSGNPKVTVSFVYGNTSGALAPADKSNPGEQGSAWSISAAVDVDQTAGWTVSNPAVTSGSNSPTWTLNPVSTNQQIIGTGANANVSFAFSNIFSFTPPGATQVYVQFTGFMQDENTKYNDHAFVLPILKQTTPVDRGVLNFFGPALLYITGMQTVPVSLQWTGFEIAAINLVCNATPTPVPPTYSANYPDTSPLVYDKAVINLPDVNPGTQVIFTIEGLDGNGNVLNSPQFTVSIEQQPDIYTFGGPTNVNFNLDQDATVTLNWKIYSVASIALSSASSATYTKNYPPSPLWNEDSTVISLSGLTESTSIEFTLKGYDAEGNLLNSMPCTVGFTLTGWCDPKDQKVYPIVTINNQTWLAQNYDYNDPTGSCFYNNDPSYEAVYGRLYTLQSAQNNVPAGWRLPTDDDWNALADFYGDNAYNALLAGGSSGLNLQLGGENYLDVGFDNMGSSGVYWGLATEGPNLEGVAIITAGRVACLDVPPEPGYSGSCSIRFIRSAESFAEIMKDKSTSGIGSVSLVVANSAAANQPIVYVGVTAALQVTLTNQTGGAIGVQSDSSLEIYMPPYFTTAEVQAMSITNISQSGWNAFYNAQDVSWMLTYTGSENWADNSSLTFTIANVLCNAAPSTDTVQVNFNDLTGSSVPAQVSASLALSNPVVPTKINLDTVLHVQPEFEGIVYVSLSSDPLTNTVYLNFANTGATPLYNGTEMWQGTPCVHVSFVYGNTSGSLAPDDKRQAGEQGSAWSISGAVSVDQTAGWTVQNPDASGQSNSPVWILSPVNTNKQIIGTGNEANVSFAFSNIFSFTPPGATMMYVQFTGFTRDENTVYNDEVFTLSLFKQSAPYNRGLLNFYGPPILYVMDTQKIPVSLFWSGYEIDSVKLICNSVPPPAPYSNTYLDTTPLVYDQTISTIPSAGPGAELLFTMQSFDNDGNILNSPQFTVSIEQQAAVYTFTAPQATPFALNQPVTITLDWKIYNVVSVKITSASSADFTRSYTGGPVWTTDSASFVVNGLNAAEPVVTFQLFAYDANGKLLNSVQCTASFTLNSFTDPRDQTVYPVVVINGAAWMAANLDFNDPASHFYQDNPGYEGYTGRYYPFAAAQQDVPAGWRLSTWEDWNALLNSYGSGNAAYNALMNNGSAGFNAGSYGYLSIDNTWLTMDGLYWATDGGGNEYGVMFSSYGTPSASISDASSFYGPIVACNVRYVLNAPAAEESETVQSQTSQHEF